MASFSAFIVLIFNLPSFNFKAFTKNTENNYNLAFCFRLWILGFGFIDKVFDT